MIEMKELGFGYRRKHAVFSELNLNLKAGHVYGLLGKNGAGKSTLLKLVTGLLFPDRGELTVLGDCPSLRHPSFLSNLFFIPEEFYLPDMSMRTYIGLMAPFYPRFNKEQLEEYMNELEVPMEERFSRMSYGQKKKSLIALGLACNTALLVMDEPTNGLDIPAKSCFRKLISSVAGDNRCMIISTHQVRDLESLIDAIVIIDESHILINATTDQITEKLLFKQVTAGDDVLFEEVSIRGRWGCVPNVGNQESRLDMELFFNAVLQNPDRIGQMLK